MSPRVAIVTRTKDRPLLLQRAIKSVRAQKFTDWIHVIVNDGGDPASVDTLIGKQPTSYKDQSKIIHLKDPSGMQNAANSGVQESESEFVCIHDDDDSWEPDYLEACIAFLEHEGPESLYQGVITNSLQINEQIHQNGEIEELSRRPYIPLPEISLFRVGYENPFPPIAFCYRRSAYEQIGSYDPRFNVAGDYDFNFRFLQKFEIGVIPRPLAFYHIREKSTDGDLSNSVVAASDEHKLKYNEFKNHYLRGDNPSTNPSLALGLNAARYLVENEWVSHEIRTRTEKIEQILELISDTLTEITDSQSSQDGKLAETPASQTNPEIIDMLAKDLAYHNRLGETIDMGIATVLERVETALRDLSYLSNLLSALGPRQEETLLKLQELQPSFLDQVQSISERQVREFKSGQAEQTEHLEKISLLIRQTQTEHLAEIPNLISQTQAKVDALKRQNDTTEKGVSSISQSVENVFGSLTSLIQSVSAIEKETFPLIKELQPSFSKEIAILLEALKQELGERTAQHQSKLDNGVESIQQSMQQIRSEIDEVKSAKTLIKLGRFEIVWRSGRKVASVSGNEPPE